MKTRGQRRGHTRTGADFIRFWTTEMVHKNPNGAIWALWRDVRMTEEQRMELNELTDDELLFAGEYLRDYNGTKAVIRCGFTDDEQKAKDRARYFLSIPRVKDYVHNEETKADDDLRPENIIRRAALIEREARENGDLKLAIKCHEIYLKEKALWEKGQVEGGEEGGALTFRWEAPEEEVVPVVQDEYIPDGIDPELRAKFEDDVDIFS